MTIGEKLKHKRIELGLSLEDVSNETKISSKVLEKIEAGEAQPMIAPAILKGFIRSYSKHLKVDMDSVELPLVVSSEKVTKTDFELLDSGDEASPTSWIKWGFAGSLLILVAVGVKLVQKYSSEKYRSDVSLSNLNQGYRKQPQGVEVNSQPESAAPEPQLNGSSILAVHSAQLGEPETSLEVAIIKNDASVKEEPSLVTMKGESEDVKPLPLSKEQENSLAEPVSVSQIASSESSEVIFKEIVLETKKATLVKIKPNNKVAIEKSLDGGKFYLLREVIPFQIRFDDPSSIQVTVDGRIQHVPKNTGQPVSIEVE